MRRGRVVAVVNPETCRLEYVYDETVRSSDFSCSVCDKSVDLGDVEWTSLEVVKQQVRRGLRLLRNVRGCSHMNEDAMLADVEKAFAAPALPAPSLPPPEDPDAP